MDVHNMQDNSRDRTSDRKKSRSDVSKEIIIIIF